MRNAKMKLKIYIRIMAALTVVYLVLMLCFSAFIMRQQETIKIAQVNDRAEFVVDEIQRGIRGFIDSDNKLIDIPNIKKELVNTIPQFAYTEFKMAVFSGDYNLLYSVKDEWLCSYAKEKKGGVYYVGYGLLNPSDWFDEATVNEIENYLNAEPKAKKVNDISGYSVSLVTFWLDNEVIIPDTVMINTMYADNFDEHGNLIGSSSHQMDEPFIYKSVYQNTKNLPYMGHGSILPYRQYNIMGNQPQLAAWVTDKERLITAVENMDVFYSEKAGLFSKRYYMVRPYEDIFYNIDETGNKEYYSPILSVFAWEVNQLYESRNTLIFLWISSLLVFIIAACVLAENTYRTYQKREAIEKQRIDTTSALAHDLKTPLSIISGYAENLLYNVHTEKRDYYALSIIDNINRMDEIIQEMLELYRLSPEFFKPSFEDISINTICAKVSGRYGDICQDRRIKLSVNGDAVIKADSILIERVIDNFFVNAINNTSEEESIEIQIYANKFEIYNSGAHLPKESINEIWNAYKKINISPEKEGSSGLGLLIARTILEMHNFSYGAENTDKGVVFWFAF